MINIINSICAFIYDFKNNPSIPEKYIKTVHFFGLCLNMCYSLKYKH